MAHNSFINPKVSKFETESKFQKTKKQKMEEKNKIPAGRVNLRCGTIEEVKLGSKLEVGSGMRGLPPWILHSECGSFSLSMAVLSFTQRNNILQKIQIHVYINVGVY